MFARPMRARHRAAPVPRRRVARFVGLLAAVVVLLSGWGISAAATASAAPSAAPGAVGHDLSTPQCGRTLPEIGVFGIVGINGGRAFSDNPCFASQYGWAKRRAAASVSEPQPARVR